MSARKYLEEGLKRYMLFRQFKQVDKELKTLVSVMEMNNIDKNLIKQIEEIRSKLREIRVEAMRQSKHLLNGSDV